MTQKTETASLVVAKRLWHNGQFYAVNTPWTEIDNDPANPVAERTVSQYVKDGFLADSGELEQARNPEAFQKATEVAALTAQLSVAQTETQLLQRKLDGAPDPAEFERLGKLAMEVVEVLRPELTEADLSAEVRPTPVTIIARLQGERDALKTQLQDAQSDTALADAQTRVKTLEALVKPEGEGAPLSPTFLRRGKLAAFGLDTYESLQGKTAAQLNAIEGITLEDGAKIVGLVASHFAKSESTSE